MQVVGRAEIGNRRSADHLWQVRERRFYRCGVVRSGRRVSLQETLLPRFPHQKFLLLSPRRQRARQGQREVAGVLAVPLLPSSRERRQEQQRRYAPRRAQPLPLQLGTNA